MLNSFFPIFDSLLVGLSFRICPKLCMCMFKWKHFIFMAMFLSTLFDCWTVFRELWSAEENRKRQRRCRVGDGDAYQRDECNKSGERKTFCCDHQHSGRRCDRNWSDSEWWQWHWRPHGEQMEEHATEELSIIVQHIRVFRYIRYFDVGCVLGNCWMILSFSSHGRLSMRIFTLRRSSNQADATGSL